MIHRLLCAAVCDSTDLKDLASSQIIDMIENCTVHSCSAISFVEIKKPFNWSGDLDRDLSVLHLPQAASIEDHGSLS